MDEKEIKEAVSENKNLLILHMRSRELHQIDRRKITDLEDEEIFKIHKKLGINDCEDGYVYDDIVDKIIRDELKDVKVNYFTYSKEVK